MVADDIHDRAVGAAGVVQVGETVRKAGDRMQQRRRRAPRHPGIAIRGAGDDTFTEAQNAAHRGLAIERRNKMHL